MHLSSRKVKSIDTERFKSDIVGSLVTNNCSSSIDVNYLVSRYSAELTRILDNHAPLMKRNVVIRPGAPWYNDNIKNAKLLRRRFERRWRRSRDHVDRSNYVKQFKATLWPIFWNLHDQAIMQMLSPVTVMTQGKCLILLANCSTLHLWQQISLNFHHIAHQKM